MRPKLAEARNLDEPPGDRRETPRRRLNDIASELWGGRKHRLDRSRRSTKFGWFQGFQPFQLFQSFKTSRNNSIGLNRRISAPAYRSV